MPERTSQETDGELADRYRATGDRAARNELVERHRQIADLYARRFGHRGADPEDLRQVGLLAMVRAVDRYDSSRGVSFSTFASRTVEGEIKRYFRDKTWSVRPPRDLQELHLRVRRASEELTHRLGRSPTVVELACDLDETVDHVLEAMEAAGAHSADPVAPSRPDDDTELADHPSLATIDESFDHADTRTMIDALITNLPEREQVIIYLRFFEGKTQPEIAAEMGVSQSYLSRIIRKTLARMRDQVDLVA